MLGHRHHGRDLHETEAEAGEETVAEEEADEALREAGEEESSGRESGAENTDRAGAVRGDQSGSQQTSQRVHSNLQVRSGRGLNNYLEASCSAHTGPPALESLHERTEEEAEGVADAIEDGETGEAAEKDEPGLPGSTAGE